MSCPSGKVGLDSWSRAETTARAQRRRHGTTIAPYRCRECGGIHTGSKLGNGDSDHRSKMRAARKAARYWEPNEREI